MGDFQFCSCTHQLQKPGKQSDIGAGKGINGLPVITHRHYFGLRDLWQALGQVEPLASNILEFIDDNILVGQREILTLDLMEIEVGVVDHIGKVDLVIPFQNRLVIVVHLLCNVQK